MTLRSLRVRNGDQFAEISEQANGLSDVVSYASDPALEAAFGAYPPLATRAADEQGIVHDGHVGSIVERALAVLNEKNQPLEESKYGAR